MIIMGERWSVGATIVSRFYNARRWLIFTGLVSAIAGCKGSIEGSVFGTDSPQPLRLSGKSVFLLAASADVGSALKAACPSNAAGWNEAVRAERERFGELATAYSDSARDEFAQHRSSRRWTALIRLMNVYRDSAASMTGQPPPIPGDLIEKLSINQVNTSSDGRFAFRELPPGTYLVATELRDEYRWVPVEVKRSTAVADVTPRGSRTTCDVARGL
jgi:hypothetical protein